MKDSDYDEEWRPGPLSNHVADYTCGWQSTNPSFLTRRTDKALVDWASRKHHFALKFPNEISIERLKNQEDSICLEKDLTKSKKMLYTMYSFKILWIVIWKKKWVHSPTWQINSCFCLQYSVDHSEFVPECNSTAQSFPYIRSEGSW